MTKKITIISVISFVMLILADCNRIQDAVVDGAIRGTSRAASKKAEQEVYERMAPEGESPAPKTPQWNNYMASHARIIFGYSFAPGGVWVSRQDYEPGEYTIYKAEQSERDSETTVEKAFLKKLENGDEWWRVIWSEGDEEIIYEGLITSSGQFKKLVAQDSDGNEGKIMVEGQKVYREPDQLSEEDIDQSRVDSKNITTSAGTFETEKIRYSATTPEVQGYILWWISSEVPGGVVKYQIHDDEDNRTLTVTLTETGQGAERILD